jgi:hypothetical protein
MDDLSGLPSGTVLDGILKTLNLDGSILGEVLSDFSEFHIAPELGISEVPVWRVGGDDE